MTTAYLLGFFFLKIELKLDLFFQDFITLIEN